MLRRIRCCRCLFDFHARDITLLPCHAATPYATLRCRYDAAAAICLRHAMLLCLLRHDAASFDACHMICHAAYAIFLLMMFRLRHTGHACRHDMLMLDAAADAAAMPLPPRRCR